MKHLNVVGLGSNIVQTNSHGSRRMDPNVFDGLTFSLVLI